jgi:hypothetical protein
MPGESLKKPFVKVGPAAGTGAPRSGVTAVRWDRFPWAAPASRRLEQYRV